MPEDEDKMKQLINACWESIGDHCDDIEKTPGMKVTRALCEEKEVCLETTFDALYKETQKQMAHPKHHLDRHKTAAILIISIIQTNVAAFEYNGSPQNLALEQLAISVGLDYMLSRLNIKLRKVRELRKQDKKVAEFILPLTCKEEQSFLTILARNLHNYTIDFDSVSHVFDLASQLYLFEYITLLKNEINPALLGCS